MLTSRIRPSRWITSASNEASARRRRRSVLARSSSSERARAASSTRAAAWRRAFSSATDASWANRLRPADVGLVEDAAGLAGGQADRPR